MVLNFQVLGDCLHVYFHHFIPDIVDQMQMVADSYRSKDHLFVETKAFTEIKSVVESMYWGTLLGKPGDGKSATAAHLLLQYSDRGYEPVFVSSPRDWKMLISGSPSSRQIVVIDDMFGQSYLDDNKNVGEWKSLMGDMSRIVKQRKGNLLIICTSRRYIFKDIESALDKFDLFSKHSIVDMTDEQFKLSGKEKVAIFKTFANTYTIEPETVLSTICNVEPPHGFPHCVELYCSNTFLRQQGIAFFENPVQYVQREISNFRDNDRVKFLVLLLVLYKDEQLGIEALDRLIENTNDDEEKFFKTAGVSLETAIPDIHRALNGLTNTYLKQNKEGSYSFSHHSLKETLAFIYISINPSHAFRVLDFKHIVAYTRPQKETAKQIVPKVCLPFEPLAKRMISEIKDGHASTVCDCEVWNDKTFVGKWLKRIENEQLSFLEAVFFPNQTAIRITKWNSLLIGLIRKERYDAATTLLKSEPIGKALLNSDLWVKSLQAGLEFACADHEPNIALISALVSTRCGENRLKLDVSELLSKMLQCAKAEVAILLIDHTSITAQDSQNIHGLYQYFHLLARSKIDMPQFEELCKKLLEAGFYINQTEENDVPAVFKCLTRFEDKGDINHTDGNDVPAVFKCLTGFEDNVWNRLLCMVNYGANIHKHSKHGNIVMFAVNNIDLHISSTLCIKILTKLSELNVDFCCTDSMGSNALHIICQRHPDEGSHALIEYLLKKGVTSEAVNKSGTVPLMLALKNDFSIDIIQLLAKNTPPKHVDESGQGYFHYLLSSCFITDTDEFCDKCELLIKLGASINGKDNSGKPPIVHLMERRNYRYHKRCSFVKMFQFFHEHGMDLHVKDDRGRNVVLSVLYCLGKRELLTLLHYFHSIKLDLKASDNNGQNALHYLFSKAFYNDKVFEECVLRVTKREFPESSGNILEEIYTFLTYDIGLLPTIGDKNGTNAVMLALKNGAGFSWIKDLLQLDIPLQADDMRRSYFHFLAESRASEDKFQVLKSALLDKGVTVDEQVLNDRRPQVLPV